MRKNAFKAWLASQGKASNNPITCCGRVESAMGDLDVAFEADQLESVLERLTYSKQDERRNRPAPDGLHLGENVSIYNGMATLKAHVQTYRRFRLLQDGQMSPCNNKNFNQEVRKLFRKWLEASEGGLHTHGVSSSYGTYVENSGIAVPALFAGDELYEAGVDAVSNNVGIALSTVKGNVRAGLLAFHGFLKWVVEHGWCKSYDELASYLSVRRGNERESSSVRQRETMQRRVEEVDAFKAFFDYFRDKKITPQAFYQFGMESSVFADKVNDEYAARQFDNLVTMLKTGKLPPNAAGDRDRKHLSIRKYSGSEGKSDWFVALYARVFSHVQIKVEGNASPKLNMRSATKCEMYSSRHIGKNTTTVLKNYVCSHVFDNRTQNPLLFEAVWNMALTPKMIDPLTGSEAKGRWPDEFQPLFRNRVREKFLPCIKEFNRIAAEVRQQIKSAALEVAREKNLGEQDKNRFVCAAVAQWEPIPEEMEESV